MPRKLQPATFQASDWLNACLHHLQNAREAAENAGCPMLERKIKSAIKSQGGARRHMNRRLTTQNTNITMAEVCGAKLRERDGRWSWTYGLRTSIDQHGTDFATSAKAAEHFLSTSEGKSALRRHYPAR